VYVRPRPGARAADARAALTKAYASEPFVRVLPEGELPSLRSVRGSNFCDVALVEDARNDTWILLSTLDNLGKGASGQAVQCANLMCGFAEEAGLLDAPWVP
jgi:N-acetyl-gamma-glutamyl-phosphate reductase